MLVISNDFIKSYYTFWRFKIETSRRVSICRFVYYFKNREIFSKSHNNKEGGFCWENIFYGWIHELYVKINTMWLVDEYNILRWWFF